MRHAKLTAVISILTLILFNAAYGAETSPVNRPARWAKPISEEGVPNLYKVSETLYRSGQPSAAGMKSLKSVLAFR